MDSCSETSTMRDSTKVAILLFVSIPFACTHDDRDAESPAGRVPGSAGGEVGPAPPAVTNEPLVPGVPNASGDQPASSIDPNPGSTLTDSRTTIKPMGIAQRAAGGTGGTLGTGGTGLGGMGGTTTGGFGTGANAIAR
jgi:hypothetical protein